MFGHIRFNFFQHFIHHGFGFAHAQAADTIAGKIHIGKRLCAFDSQILIKRALNDAEQRLILARVRRLAALRPPVGALPRVLRAPVIARIWRTLVKRHRNIRSKILLHLHGNLRRQKFSGTVNMRLEHHPIVGDLVDLRQGVNLEPAAVGQNRTIPVHKPMQTAGISDNLRSRPQKKMIGIGKDDLCAALLQFVRRNPLHRRLRPNRHENRRLNHAMRGMKRPSRAHVLAC
jgi:hypothetical protein